MNRNRIGIDISDIATGVVGVGSLIHRQLEYLMRHKNPLEYVLYQNMKKPYVERPDVDTHFSRLKTYSFAKEQLFFAGRSVIDKLAIFHATIHLPPIEHNPKTKIVFTVPDLHVERYPQYYPKQMVNYFSKRRSAAIRSVDKVLVISNMVKEDVLSLTGIAEEKVAVLPLGVKKEFFMATSPVQKQTVRDKYSLPENFILYVGSVEPWKRVSFLVDAFRLYKKKTDNPIELVIVGREGWQRSECDYVRMAVERNDDIHWLGYVAQGDVPTLYQLSKVYASASVCEGFGLPFIEAMASGVPVIGANATAIPETIANAGVFFDPMSKESLQEAISSVVDDHDKRRMLIEKGRERAKDCSWDDFGEKIVSIYESLL